MASHESMPVEQKLEEVLAALREQAGRDERMAQDYFGKHPDLTPDTIEHSPGATHRRLAGIFLGAAEKVSQVYREMQRQVVRASNPALADMSDRQVDNYLRELEEVGKGRQE